MAIRSGRFNFSNQTAGSTAPHIIVTLSEGAKSVAFYRVFNSGQHTFQIKVLNKNGGTEVTKELEPDNSIDVAVDEEGTVQVTWAAPGTAKDVSGIYNFLGDKDTNSQEDVRSGRYTGDPGNGGKVFADYKANTKATAVYRILNSGDDDITLHSDYPADNTNSIITLKPTFSVDISPLEGGKLVVDAALNTKADMIYEFLAGALK